LLSLGSKWPCFFINYGQTIPLSVGQYTNTFNYQKIDIKIDHRIYMKVRGYINYQILAGKVFGNVPYSFQSNNNSSRLNKYYISAENSFESMYINEFISTQYASLFTIYNTGKFIKPNKYINPEIEIINNIGIGQLLNREKLTYIELSDISRSYTETGLRLKNLYQSGMSSFGVGVFYRYGYYALPEMKQNIVYKFVLGINLN
jgi:hypothetical protein